MPKKILLLEGNRTRREKLVAVLVLSGVARTDVIVHQNAPAALGA